MHTCHKIHVGHMICKAGHMMYKEAYVKQRPSCCYTNVTFEYSAIVILYCLLFHFSFQHTTFSIVTTHQSPNVCNIFDMSAIAYYCLSGNKHSSDTSDPWVTALGRLECTLNQSFNHAIIQKQYQHLPLLLPSPTILDS